MTLIKTLELTRYFSPIYVTTDICNSFQDIKTHKRHLYEMSQICMCSW